jgi:hypothetical protein
MSAERRPAGQRDTPVLARHRHRHEDAVIAAETVAPGEVVHPPLQVTIGEGSAGQGDCLSQHRRRDVDGGRAVLCCVLRDRHDRTLSVLNDLVHIRRRDRCVAAGSLECHLGKVDCPAKQDITHRLAGDWWRIGTKHVRNCLLAVQDWRVKREPVQTAENLQRDAGAEALGSGIPREDRGCGVPQVPRVLERPRVAANDKCTSPISARRRYRLDLQIIPNPISLNARSQPLRKDQKGFHAHNPWHAVAGRWPWPLSSSCTGLM